MKMSKKICVLISLIMCLALVFTACGGSKNNAANDGNKAETKAEQPKDDQSKEKVKLVIVMKQKDFKWIDAYYQKLQEKFPQYEIVPKEWDNATAEKTIKTMIAAGNAPDIALYWPNYMQTFVDANMALDLTPYLEENNGAWKNTFADGSLDIGKINGKYYNVAFESVYPLMLINKDLTDKAGVKVPDGPWSWEEFVQACKTIKEKLNIYPFGIRYDWSCWIVRNGLLSNWKDKSQINDFISGKIPFMSPESVKAFDTAKAIYDNDFAYPGKGAIVAKNEEIQSAFKSGKIAIAADVNIFAPNTLKNVGLKNVQIASWPHMGPNDVLLGGCDGLFIPSNSKHQKEAVEVLKYMTSPEMMQMVVDAGSPVTVKGVKSSDPLFPQFAKDTSKVYPGEVINLSPKINDTIVNKMPAEYIRNGKKSLEDLDKLREAALKEKK